MALVVQASPTGLILPATSPAYWTVYDSINYSQPNFSYTIKITDVITGLYTIKEYLPRFTDNKAVFDTNFYAEEFVEHYIPKNLYNFKVCMDGYRLIRVNVGMTYGSTPTYYAGTNYDYYVWNAVEDYSNWPTYSQANYVYTNTAPFVYLNNGVAESGYRVHRGTTYADKSLYLYVLATVSNTLETLRVKTYNSAGTLLGTSNIANVFYNNATYSNKYFCIDVGYKGLSQIPSGDVTGTYPIITSSVAYYELFDVNTSAGTPPAGTVEPIQRIDILCEAKCDVFTLHYLNSKGAFSTCHFPKVSTDNRTTTKSTYKKTPYELNASNVYTYSPSTPQEIVLNSTTQKKLTLQTDWLTYEEIDRHAEIVDAPVCYLDMGSTIGLVPVTVETNSYVVLNEWNTGNPYFSITVRYGYTDTKQRG